MTNPYPVPSQADFEAWKQAPWWASLLSRNIDDLNSRLAEMGVALGECPENMISRMRLEMAKIKGFIEAFESLQELEHEDTLPEEAENAEAA